jgi:hypothetical protein
MEYPLANVTEVSDNHLANLFPHSPWIRAYATFPYSTYLSEGCHCPLFLCQRVRLPFGSVCREFWITFRDICWRVANSKERCKFFVLPLKNQEIRYKSMGHLLVLKTVKALYPNYALFIYTTCNSPQSRETVPLKKRITKSNVEHYNVATDRG